MPKPVRRVGPFWMLGYHVIRFTIDSDIEWCLSQWDELVWRHPVCNQWWRQNRKQNLPSSSRKEQIAIRVTNRTPNCDSNRWTYSCQGFVWVWMLSPISAFDDIRGYQVHCRFRHRMMPKPVRWIATRVTNPTPNKRYIRDCLGYYIHLSIPMYHIHCRFRHRMMPKGTWVGLWRGKHWRITWDRLER